MGLDMYLNAKRFLWHSEDEIANRVGEVFPELGDARVKEITAELMYWRKCNAIHKWFVDNVQNGEDDCGEYYVPNSKLIELLTTARQCLFTKDPNLLPPQSGFFFGNTDIDEWYWHGIKDTIKQLKRLSELPDFDELSFYYQSSW